MRLSPKSIGGILGGWILILCVFVSSLWLHRTGDWRGYSITALVGLSGIAVGWLVGLLASPYDRSEKTRFAKYSEVISAFLGGYVLSKIDPTLSLILSNDNLIRNPIYGARVLVFVTCLITAAITMYVYRLYDHLERTSGSIKVGQGA